MTFQKTFIINNKSNTENKIYSLTGLSSNYEFNLESTKSSKLCTEEEGGELITCKQVNSWWSSEIEITLPNPINQNIIHFSKQSNAKSFKVQGSLKQNVEVDWRWKFDSETTSYELIDREHRVLADIVDFTLKKKCRGKLRITDSLSDDVEHLILTSACLIWSI
ncbi:hypothetical protein CONCODRAFT_80309, partial [Conidiobolus coronatus NRRL 28638]